ncbi:YHS domain-containing (seleno)protein [Terrimonas pollutisoli]|uniref:YHS domain-containing (seleno)protein n=1 Tax=Terrimonas pollutisoli TaxID=3034147 RepID=UPI0023EB9095|nr:YHS domain-containing (seleno)protein [Terrimonas sp. H1YJ31]
MNKIKWLLILTLLANLSLQAQRSATFIESGKAIRGYDPVAYFTQSKAVKGNDKLIYQWNNASWHFSSAENLELFKTNPEKYAPQYGGYCAYGLSNGYKAPTSADAWTIENGKLYLNYNLKVREEWNKDRQQRIEKADKNWPEVKDKG